VVRGGVEPPTFRLSGRAYTLIAWKRRRLEGARRLWSALATVTVVVSTVVSQRQRLGRPGV
jgi:hypothetical protein